MFNRKRIERLERKIKRLDDHIKVIALVPGGKSCWVGPYYTEISPRVAIKAILDGLGMELIYTNISEEVSLAKKGKYEHPYIWSATELNAEFDAIIKRI